MHRHVRHTAALAVACEKACVSHRVRGRLSMHSLSHNSRIRIVVLRYCTNHRVCRAILYVTRRTTTWMR